MLLLIAVYAAGFSVAYAASASVTETYPADTVPPGVRVSFIVLPSGFTQPTYWLVDSFAGGATTVNIDGGGSFSWTPNKDDVGSHGLTITVSDSEGHSATVSKTITVVAAATLTAGDPSPAAAVSIGASVMVTTEAKQFFSPTYSVKDSVSSSVQSYNMKSDGTFSWTPLATDVGTHMITITAKDSYGSEASDSIEITVLPPPAVSAKNLPVGNSVHAGSELTFSIVVAGFVDPSFTASDDAYPSVSAALTVSDTGAVSWTPSVDDFGKHVLRLAAHDSVRSATTTITIQVLEPLPTEQPEAFPNEPEDSVTDIPPMTVSVAQQAPSSESTKQLVVASPAKQALAPASPVQESVVEHASTTGTSLAFPSQERDVPQPIAADHPAEIMPFLEGPSFAEFIWDKVSSFFGALLGIFGR